MITFYSVWVMIWLWRMRLVFIPLWGNKVVLPITVGHDTEFTEEFLDAFIWYTRLHTHHVCSWCIGIVSLELLLVSTMTTRYTVCFRISWCFSVTYGLHIHHVCCLMHWHYNLGQALVTAMSNKVAFDCIGSAMLSKFEIGFSWLLSLTWIWFAFIYH